jgi:hypothetical protein
MRFHFIHAADLHIDSPLESLGVKDPAVALRFQRANRTAVEALVRETIDGGAKFLVIAGDVFDGDWKDVSTGLFFARQLGELHRAGIPTFLVKAIMTRTASCRAGLPIRKAPSPSPRQRPRRCAAISIRNLHSRLHDARAFQSRQQGCAVVALGLFRRHN